MTDQKIHTGPPAKKKRKLDDDEEDEDVHDSEQTGEETFLSFFRAD